MKACHKHAQIISQTEKELASSFFTKDLSLKENPFFKESLKRIADIRQFKGHRHFLMIGSGSIPTTLYFAIQEGLARHYSAIDPDQEALDNGLKYLKCSGLSDPVNGHCQEAQGHSFGDYDLIFIANLVIGKADVLKRIWETSLSETKVILRLPTAPEYGELVSEFDLKDWQVLGQGRGSKEFSSFNLYLQKP